MTIKELLKREKHVVIHGQTARFRIIKYLVLLIIGIGLYQWNGWSGVIITFLILFVLSIAVHLLFRWKTKAWTQSWGPYKKIDLPV
jgi:hypothetical protein